MRVKYLPGGNTFYMGQAIYHHGASVPSKIPAASAIQWAAIREAKETRVPSV